MLKDGKSHKADFATYRDSHSGPVAKVHAIRLVQPYFSAAVPKGQTITLEEWHRQNDEKVAA